MLNVRRYRETFAESFHFPLVLESIYCKVSSHLKDLKLCLQLQYEYVLCCACYNQYMSNIPEIDVNEAKSRIEAGSVLVDVREQNEYDQEHIAGSLLIPLSEFEARFEELPKDKELVMQCRSGARSGQATEFLNAQGYNAVNMTGGILAWAAADLGTE